MSPDALYNIQKAFDDRLALYQSTNVAWDDVPYTPAEGVAYLDATMAAETLRPLGSGADGFQMWEGIYQVNVHHPIGEGLEPIKKQVGAIIDHFRRGTSLFPTDGGTVVITEASPSRRILSGDWVSIPVQIRWFKTEV